MLKLASIFFCILFSTSLSYNKTSSSEEWVIKSSTVKFTIKNAGFMVTGAFSGLKAKVVFDPDKSSENSILATIDAGTISTGNATRDEHLRKSEYFNVSVFPTITMQSLSINKEALGTYKGRFRLSIKGISKEIEVPFKFSEKDGAASFTSNFSINRVDFGVGKSSLILSDKVDVTVLLNVSNR